MLDNCLLIQRRLLRLTLAVLLAALALLVVGVVYLASGDPGGSTIAQQLAKHLYDKGSGLGSRLREIGLTVKLSLSYSKSTIMSMYLNAIYYGNGYWGDEQAALVTSTPLPAVWTGLRRPCSPGSRKRRARMTRSSILRLPSSANNMYLHSSRLRTCSQSSKRTLCTTRCCPCGERTPPRS